ncbi:hypothetical protein [Dysgonomonas reticulitermitis]
MGDIVKIKNYNKGVNSRLCQLLLGLNLLLLSTLACSLSFHSILFRIIQIITISISFFIVKNNLRLTQFSEIRTYIRLLFFLWLSMLLPTIINGFDFPSIIELIIIYTIHFLYIWSLIKIISNVKEATYQRMILLLFIFNLLHFFIYFSTFSIDFSYFSGSIEDFIYIKRGREAMLGSDYSIVYPALIVLTFFMSFKYILKLNLIYKIAIIIAIFLCLLYSLIFTLVLSFIGTILFYLFWKKKTHAISVKKMYFTYFIVIGIVIVLGIWNLEELNKYTTGRSILWVKSISHISNNILFGISHESFYDDMYIFSSKFAASLGIDYSDNALDISAGGCHQMLLNWLLFYGILSFIIYIVFVGYNWTLVGRINNKFDRICIYVPLVFVLIRGLVESPGFIGSSKGAYEFLLDIHLGYMVVMVIRSKYMSY